MDVAGCAASGRARGFNCSIMVRAALSVAELYAVQNVGSDSVKPALPFPLTLAHDCMFPSVPVNDLENLKGIAHASHSMS
jgi:hypothetical protein